MDAGIFPLIKKPFPDFEKIFIMKNPASDIRQWCKPLPKFSNNIICEDFFNKSLVVDACIIGIKKNDYCIDFINLWKEYCKNDELISDQINKNYYHPNFDIFRDHRHDQSLLSIVSFEKNVKIKRKST